MYSERLRELFHTRPHAGKLAEATHYGQGGVPGQGPFIQLWLRVVGERVEAARFKTYGCPAAIACAEALCQALEGAEIEALKLSAEQLAEWAGGIPEEKVHCPQLALEAWETRRPVSSASSATGEGLKAVSG